jgi:hypothetical protein
MNTPPDRDPATPDLNNLTDPELRDYLLTRAVAWDRMATELPELCAEPADSTARDLMDHDHKHGTWHDGPGPASATWTDPDGPRLYVRHQWAHRTA